MSSTYIPEPEFPNFLDPKYGNISDFMDTTHSGTGILPFLSRLEALIREHDLLRTQLLHSPADIPAYESMDNPEEARRDRFIEAIYRVQNQPEENFTDSNFEKWSFNFIRQASIKDFINASDFLNLPFNIRNFYLQSLGQNDIRNKVENAELEVLLKNLADFDPIFTMTLDYSDYMERIENGGFKSSDFGSLYFVVDLNGISESCTFAALHSKDSFYVFNMVGNRLYVSSNALKPNDDLRLVPKWGFNLPFNKPEPKDYLTPHIVGGEDPDSEIENRLQYLLDRIDNSDLAYLQQSLENLVLKNTDNLADRDFTACVDSLLDVLPYRFYFGGTLDLTESGFNSLITDYSLESEKDFSQSSKIYLLIKLHESGTHSYSYVSFTSKGYLEITFPRRGGLENSLSIKEYVINSNNKLEFKGQIDLEKDDLQTRVAITLPKKRGKSLSKIFIL